ncbi:MAG: hypothetical protein ABI609_05055 [Acidobacteriota bacterium]
MARWLFLLGLIVLVLTAIRRSVILIASGRVRAPLWYLLLSGLLGQPTLSKSAAPRAPRSVDPLPVGRLVRCARCGSYFPEARSFPAPEAGAFCSEACASGSHQAATG